ncbi:MAG TPA: MerR family transcriptional regulator [Pseudolabrys sp.]|nr:MerR family transcriptional regulator [Pseudolabrys sp.]
MDEKSPDAFRTISEAADELDLPQHVLRFWESRFREIKPMKRGGGRRFYRPDDLDLLRGIRHLLYGEGYTIRGVQRILREHGIRFVQAVWQEGAAQPPHRAADEDELIEETVEAGYDDEADEEERGIGSRLGALIGRDLNERNGSGTRREPPMTAAPMPRLSEADRAVHAAVEAEPQVEVEVPVGVPTAVRALALGETDLDRLRNVLQDLTECRRLIDAAVARPD